MPLQALYPLDGNANDVRGSNDGTVNGATVDSNGILGTQCYSFDGTDDNINAGNVSDLDIASNDLRFTISAWVNTADNSSNQGIVGKSGTDSGQFAGYYLGFTDFHDSDGNYELTLYLRDTSGNVDAVYADSVIPDGTWKHVVAISTGDGATNKEIYVDGEKKSITQANNQGTGTFSTIDDFMIGDRSNTDTFPFNGKVDSVRIYDHALTPSEVQYLYDKTRAPAKIALQPKKL